LGQMGAAYFCPPAEKEGDEIDSVASVFTLCFEVLLVRVYGPVTSSKQYGGYIVAARRVQDDYERTLRRLESGVMTRASPSRRPKL